MSNEFARNPQTGLVEVNPDKVNDVIRNLLGKIKSLHGERDILKKKLESQNLDQKPFCHQVENKLNKVCDAEIREDDGEDDDDLETDGASPERPGNFKGSPISGIEPSKSKECNQKTFIKEETNKKERNLQVTESKKPNESNYLLNPIDHSSCCSKELSLKLVEQNQILQRTIKEILSLKGSSLDDYLKYSYNNDRIRAKDREMEDLKKQVRQLERKLSTGSCWNCEKLEKELKEKVDHITRLEVELMKKTELFNSLIVPTETKANPPLNHSKSDVMLSQQPKSPQNEFRCENCHKKFNAFDQNYHSHIRKCIDQ